MCCYVTCREISVQWVTKDVGTPTVRYGMSPDGLTSSKTGNTTSYIRQDMCGPPANSYGWIDPGTMNNVVLTNLTPSTTYYYSYGDPVSLRTLSYGTQALNRKQCSALHVRSASNFLHGNNQYALSACARCQYLAHNTFWCSCVACSPYTVAKTT